MNDFGGCGFILVQVYLKVAEINLDAAVPQSSARSLLGFGLVVENEDSEMITLDDSLNLFACSDSFVDKDFFFFQEAIQSLQDGRIDQFCAFEDDPIALPDSSAEFAVSPAEERVCLGRLFEALLQVAQA